MESLGASTDREIPQCRIEAGNTHRNFSPEAVGALLAAPPLARAHTASRTGIVF
jgi:hypothetical protein